jgi:ABC-type lipoprotein export system ATPase subunit
VSKSYGAIKILENVNIRVEKGQTFCIIGPSGCGKSTLLKVMALITRADKGVVTINGTDIHNASLTDNSQLDRIRSSVISYSFQESLLLPYLSALDNIVTVLSPIKKEESSGNHLENEAKNMLSKLGLANRLQHYPSKLSVGEKKRVDLARALLKGSELLIADEPLSNLDPDIGNIVMDLLKERAQKGAAVVYSSVSPSDSRYADRTYSIKASLFS